MLVAAAPAAIMTALRSMVCAAMPSSKTVTAAVLLIGNEILSGRTQDANLNHIAKGLTEVGVKMAEARVVPDIEGEIVEAVNTLRAKYDYVFTTGGIGPTHDDITAGCIAKAFGVPLHCHPEAVKLLEAAYEPAKLNEARLKMAETPVGADLVKNAVSAAPGFRMENVYVMAGVPAIMRAMFDEVKHTLAGGPPVISRTVATGLPEGAIAEGLGAMQDAYPDIDIGSYPFFRQGGFGVHVVLRGSDAARLDRAVAAVIELLVGLGGDGIEDS